MLETLKAWLNGTREYYTGAALYNILGNDEKIKALFARGYSLYNNFRLQEELKTICQQLKKEKNTTSIIPKPSTSAKERAKPKAAADPPANGLEYIISKISNTVEKIATTVRMVNTELYEACRVEANKAYKEAMNKRAVLFGIIPSNKFENANRQELVAGRKDLALEVVKLYNKASELYDRADYAKLHGKLPDEPAEDIAGDIAALQNHEVKDALNNVRKAKSKLKGREQTAERISLIQKHDLKIKLLEERWLCLKQKK